MSKNLHKEGEQIVVKVAPNDIDFFNKLIEGYDNVALVSTIDAQIGRLVLWVSEHTKKDALAILRCLPIPVEVLD